MTLTVSSCDRFLAHKDPDECLLDHLLSVGSACKQRMSQLGADERLQRVAELIGKTHDFGKYNPFFQKYIRGEKKKGSELYSHAPISAVYCAFALHNAINDPFISLVGSYCVWNHHGNLDKTLIDFVVCDLKDFTDNKNYKKQLDSIKESSKSIQEELSKIGLPSIQDFVDFVEGSGFSNLVSSMHSAIPVSGDFESFYNLLLLFSVLIDSDKKLSAHAGVSRSQCFTGNPDDWLNNLKIAIDSLKNDDSKMAMQREIVRQAVLSELQGLLSSHKIPKFMCLHAPTGIGKTLLSFECAIRVRKEVKNLTGRDLRIIYVLPYVNIIEQAYDVLSKIVASQDKGINEFETIIKHHHLYTPMFHAKDGSEFPNHEKMLLIESWDSEIIVTTFVQFLETLIGTRNKMLKKFNKIYDSIIVLDEVQAFPPELWNLVVESLRGLPDNVYILMMSATLPSLFSEFCYPLLKDTLNYFRRINRVKYLFEPSDFDIESLADFVMEKWNQDSILAVVNTVRSSINLYRGLKKRMESFDPICLGVKQLTDEHVKNDSPILAYLSTNIIPKERMRRIRAIDCALRSSKPVILVSTQVVEAGVDLDFGTVVREIAPLDSIVQSGGRCNRNWRSEQGTVYVVKIKEKDRYNWKYVYSPLSIERIAIPFFEKYNVLEEKELVEKLSQYFEEKVKVESLNYASKSLDYISAVRDLNFKKISEFRLIQEEPKASVFVNIDEDSNSCLEYLRSTWREVKMAGRNYSLLNKLRFAWRKAQEYIVDTWRSDSLPAEFVLPEDDGVRLVQSDSIGMYYDLETGLKVEQDSIGYIF